MQKTKNKEGDNSVVAISKVLITEDKMGGGRIKVRIDPYDVIYPTDQDLPFCFPLLPKLVHVYPKVGESVLVIWQNPEEKSGQRFYIGPVISQDYALDYSPFATAAKSLFEGRPLYPALINPKRDADNNGTIPDLEDVAIRGRSNCDIILKPSDLRLRCGFLEKTDGVLAEDKLHYNNKLAYIQMKYREKMKDAQNKDFSSFINIVAEKINLLSHASKTPFTLGDRTELTSEDEMRNILENAHPLPYGDDLVFFLKKFIEVFRNHTHPHVMKEPTFNDKDKEVLNTNLENYLSESIRIN